jgi:hypothetical protein
VAYALGIVTVCTVALAELMVGGRATATSEPDLTSAAVADALGIQGRAVDAPAVQDPRLLEQLAASRSERDADQAAAATSQAQSEQAAAAARAEAEAQAAAEAAATAAAAAPSAATAVATISNSAGPVRPQAQAAANAVVSNVPGTDGITIGGTRSSAADPHGHPSGLALDYMVGSNAALGDEIVAYHLAHWDELGVEYII